MSVTIPSGLDEALAARAAAPEGLVVAGGTDVMVELNGGRQRERLGADDLLVIDRVAELRRWSHDPGSGTVTLGAGVTYRDLTKPPLASLLGALAEASRTVGSPQIRNAGTIGGNLGTCSPAGDALPVLAALDATVHLASLDTRRDVPIGGFMLGPKRNALAAGELITAVTVPVLDGWQGYAKVGVRNAMVIAIAAVCVAVDRATRTVRIGLGSVAPTVVRAPDAEAAAAEAADWEAGTIDADTARDVGRLTAAATAPIDDHRATAAYRRRCVEVLVGRLLQRAFGQAPRADAAVWGEAS